MNRWLRRMTALALALGLTFALAGCTDKTPGKVVDKHHYGVARKGACGELIIKPNDGGKEFPAPVAQTVYENCDIGEDYPHCWDELLVPGLKQSCS